MNKSEMRDSKLAAKKAKSTIDYIVYIDKEENPAGEHVLISLNGRFRRSKSW